MERESLFCDAWFKEHKGERPTYADAIAWAEKAMLNKFEHFLKKNNKGQLIIYGEITYEPIYGRNRTDGNQPY